MLKYLSLLLILVAASSAQTVLTIEATFTDAPQDSVVKDGTEYVFTCDGKQLRVQDTSSLPHPDLEVTLRNIEKNFECTFLTDGSYQCVRTDTSGPRTCLSGMLSDIQ